MRLEPILFRMPYGLASRFRVLLYRTFGMTLGRQNRFEAGRIRRLIQIQIGDLNHFSEGWFLWPEDTESEHKKIVIGDDNYFNRNVMLDACGRIEIGNHNMFGPDVYMTDSDHTYGPGIDPHQAPMRKGVIKIGDFCWVGAKVVILKNVELGDYCVVAAGSVVTRSFPAGSVIAGVPARLLAKSPVETTA